MNNTGETINKEYKKRTGVAYLIYAVIAYLIFSFFIASLNIDIDWFSIVFVELYFLCFWLLCYLIKPNLKPNPLIVSYIIVFSIPLFFAVNYSQIYEIGTENWKNNELFVAKAILHNESAGIKGNFYVSNINKCTGIKYTGRAVIFGILSNPLFCNELKHGDVISIYDNNDKRIGFYGGRNFLNKYNREEDNILASEYFLVSYTKHDLHYPATSLLFAMTLFRVKKNIIHSISFEHKEKYNTAYTSLNKKFNQDYFQYIYQKQKDRYILFSIAFLINALIFSAIIHWIRRL